MLFWGCRLRKNGTALQRSAAKSLPSVIGRIRYHTAGADALMSPGSSHAGCSEGSYNSDTFNDLHCNAVTHKSSSLRKCLCVRCAVQRLPTLHPVKFIEKIQAIHACLLPVHRTSPWRVLLVAAGQHTCAQSQGETLREILRVEIPNLYVSKDRLSDNP
jgi:hypothetical protein